MQIDPKIPKVKRKCEETKGLFFNQIRRLTVIKICLRYLSTGSHYTSNPGVMGKY